MPHAGGRPTDYSPELAERICDQVAQRIPVHKFAGTDGFPGESTIYKWLGDGTKPEFVEMYTRARVIAGEKFAYAALDVADQTGVIVPPDVARVKIDTLKWAAGKFAPRVYGDKIQQEVTGSEGGPLQIVITPNQANIG